MDFSWTNLKKKAAEAMGAIGLDPGAPAPTPTPTASPVTKGVKIAPSAVGPAPKKKAPAKKKPVSLAMELPEQTRSERLGLPMGPPAVEAFNLPAAAPMDPEFEADPQFEELSAMGLKPRNFVGRAQDRGFKLDDKTQQEIEARKAIKKALQIDFTPEEMAEKYDAAMQSPGVQDQLRGIKRMAEMAGIYASQPAQVDLSPLVDLVNSQWGAKFTHSGEKARGDQRARAVMDYIAKIQDDRAGVSKSIMDSIRAQKAGTNSIEDVLNDKFAEMKARELVQNPQPKPPSVSPYAGTSQLRAAESEVGKTFEGYMKNYQNRKEQLSALAEAVKKNEVGNIQALLSKVAKNIGDDAGMLSNQDISRTLPPTLATDLARFEAWLTNNPQAHTDPKIAKYLVNLARVALKNGVTRYKSDFDTAIKQMNARKSFQGLGVPVKEMAKPYQDELGRAEEVIKDFDEFANGGERVRVKLLKDYKGKKAGDVVKLPKSQLKKAIEAGLAQEVK